ncbi:MAG: 2-oxoglutarate dehydrogenase complex dihydrolipoyllysine-residue succinyltransferase [Pseudomonadales bacterium]|nr:2-oxoglutarate dehydrogenase complex dihydrolipoyllysine-residue succinyltransferase [Pseudomonadales bacterium]
MTTEIKAPPFPESITEGTVALWHVKPGDEVRRDDVLVDIETDKVVLEIVAPADGVLSEIVVEEGGIIEGEALIGRFKAGSVSSALAGEASAPEAEVSTGDSVAMGVSPAARKVAEEQGVRLGDVVGTGKGGRITKQDVLQRGSKPPSAASIASETESLNTLNTGERVERRVPMSRLRSSIAKRLVEAQHNAAMLTTFNEVNMAPIMALRKKYKDAFSVRHNGSRLGFMSFFVRACVESLKRFPSVNASIDENDIIYHGFYDIGVAVSSDRGLVVPVVRDADALSLAQIEDQVRDYGVKAQSGKLSLDDMAGGTFTISNGGVFGSLLSTPILNPPQTAILGMHKIQDRTMVEDGEIVIRPMMYLALSYDHRLIDGQEAVRFLVTIKDMLEDPARILLEL